MSGPQFFETPAGRKFFQSDMPKLINAIEQLSKTISEAYKPVALPPSTTTAYVNDEPLVTAPIVRNTTANIQDLAHEHRTSQTADDSFTVPSTTEIISSLDKVRQTCWDLHAIEDAIYYLQGKLITDGEVMESHEVKHLVATIGKLRDMLGDAPKDGRWELKLSDPNSDYSKQFMFYATVLSKLDIGDLQD